MAQTCNHAILSFEKTCLFTNSSTWQRKNRFKKSWNEFLLKYSKQLISRSAFSTICLLTLLVPVGLQKR
jgi:hypothetical protein